LNAVPDLGVLLPRLLDMAFEMIPALRAVILLNGHRVTPDPSDFISQIYRERGLDGPARFSLSSKVLEEVYAQRQPSITNNITPVLCAPLMVSGTMRGVLYMEGREAQARQRAASRDEAQARQRAASRDDFGFEPEHLYYLKGIAEIAVAAVRLAHKIE